MSSTMALSLCGEELSDRQEVEWIDANGNGGYASTTISGAHSRRYHGLLVVPRGGTLGRDVLLSRFDETLLFDGKSIEFATRTYADLTAPDSSSCIKEFSYELYPSVKLESEIGEKKASISRSIMMLQGEGTTLIRYEVHDVPTDTTLRLEPFIANRFFHALKTSSYAALDRYDWNGERLFIVPGGEVASYGIRVPDAQFQYEPDWYYRFFYKREAERGQGADEDLFRIGVFERPISPKETVYIVVSTEPSRWEEANLESVWKAEEKRRRRSSDSKGERLSFHLQRAARSFIVERGSSSRRPTIVAGYHWFSDWGRDTMISLPGVCVQSEDYERAREILKTFADEIRDGLVPNRFSDADGEAEYNSVDASLWFIVNGLECFRAKPDKEFLEQVLLPAAQNILAAFHSGTLFGIEETGDGLLRAGSGKDQLTWMDARVGEWVVTPRHGKAVEINALWCNAHFAVAEMLQALRKDEWEGFEKRGKAIRKAFTEVFWEESLGGLHDVIHEDGPDSSIRPNQIFALSLPFELLSKAKAKRVLALVEKELLTPRGLRTLSTDHPDYKGTYSGGILERDGAYHQGTVWPWLLGPYARAVSRYGTKMMKQETRSLLLGFEDHLLEHGIGTISEIFDGDYPHTPRGCISQAWSVAEILCGLKVLEE